MMTQCPTYCEHEIKHTDKCTSTYLNEQSCTGVYRQAATYTSHNTSWGTMFVLPGEESREASLC